MRLWGSHGPKDSWGHLTASLWAFPKGLGGVGWHERLESISLVLWPTVEVELLFCSGLSRVGLFFQGVPTFPQTSLNSYRFAVGAGVCFSSLVTSDLPQVLLLCVRALWHWTSLQLKICAWPFSWGLAFWSLPWDSTEERLFHFSIGSHLPLQTWWILDITGWIPCLRSASSRDKSVCWGCPWN